MIRIQRQSAPPVFNSAAAKKEYEWAKNFYKDRSNSRSQSRFEFKVLYSRQLKDALRENFNNKCAFCECPIANNEGDLELFRPKGGALDLKKKLDPDHYWWLYFEWRNYYLSCAVCNRGKKNIFPVDGPRIALLAPYEEVLKEKNLLLDPCNDDPEKHIKYNDKGLAIALSRRGETTIEIYALNRPKLVIERRRSVEELKHLLADFQKIISLFTNPSGKQIKVNVVSSGTSLLKQIRLLSAPQRSYLGIKKEIITQWLEKNPGLTYAGFLSLSFIKMAGKLAMAKEKKNFKKSIIQNRQILNLITPNSYASKALIAIRDEKLFLDRVEIKNFKSIEALAVKFPSYEVVREMEQSAKDTHDSYEPWLMLLGENGVGKSSFLQAIALTLVGKKYLSGLNIKVKNILKHGKSSGFVKIYQQQSKEPISITFSRTGKIISNYEHPTSYLLGYGSTRLFPTTILKEEVPSGKIKAKNMFRADVSLADSRKFILDVHKRSKSKTRSSEKYKELFNSMGLAVKDLLLLKGKERLRVLNGEVYIDYGNTKRDTLNELSDGYKSIMALAIDIIKTLWKDNARFANAQGIVLLDEIGTHLHPRWRMLVVKKMRNAFPSLQFIVTTHDPLCLRGLKKGEVVVFDKDENNRVFIIDDLPDSSEYRVDQLLTSPFFGLNSVVDPDLEKEFNEYYLLLRKATPSREEQASIVKLQQKLQPKLHLGGSFREELIYTAVDQVIASSNIKTPQQFLVDPAKSNAENAATAAPNKSASAEKDKAEEEVKARIRELLKKEIA